MLDLRTGARLPERRRTEKTRSDAGGLVHGDAGGTWRRSRPPMRARPMATRAEHLHGLGCTLYALLTGRPPFVEDTVVKLVLAHIEKEPQPLHELRPDVPAELSAVVAKMMAKDPAQPLAQRPVEVGALALGAAFVKARGPRRSRPARHCQRPEGAAAGTRDVDGRQYQPPEGARPGSLETARPAHAGRGSRRKSPFSGLAGVSAAGKAKPARVARWKRSRPDCRRGRRGLSRFDCPFVRVHQGQREAVRRRNRQAALMGRCWRPKRPGCSPNPNLRYRGPTKPRGRNGSVAGRSPERNCSRKFDATLKRLAKGGRQRASKGTDLVDVLQGYREGAFREARPVALVRSQYGRTCWRTCTPSRARREAVEGKSTRP